MRNIILKFISPFILLFAIQGCMPDSLTKFQKDPPKMAPAISAATSVASVDLTTLKAFQVRNITQKSTSYHLHKYGAGNAQTACEIPTRSIADGETLLVDQENDILCWLEGDEQQLYFEGVDFQINSPPGYCEYIQVKPYYYWNFPPVNTQKLTEEITCAIDTIIPATPGTPAIPGIPAIPAIPGIGGNPDTPAVPEVLAVPAVPPTPAITTCPRGVQAANMLCFGNYTSNEGPNCDEGDIVVKTTAYDATGTPAISISQPVKCGGKRTNCYMGPGVDYKVSKQGFPMAMDKLAFNGESINYSVTAPIEKAFANNSNYYISNFSALFATGPYTYDYSAVGSTTGLTNFSEDSRVSSGAGFVDMALDPLKSANSGSAKYKVNPFYEFSCLNYAHEVKARVRVQVRDWNQVFRLPIINTEVEKSAPERLIKLGPETSGSGDWNDMMNWDTPYSNSIITTTGGILVGDPLAPEVPITDYGFKFPLDN